MGFSTSVGGGLYQSIAAQFEALRPGWRLELKLHPWSDPTAGLLDESSDVAFVWLPVPDDERLELRELRSEPRWVAMPEHHRLAGHQEIDLSELLDEPFVALPPSAGPLRDYWLATDERAGHPIRIGAEAATPDETFEAVAAGLGVVLMAEGNTRVYARPGLAYRPVRGLSPSRLAVGRRRADRRRPVLDFVEAALAGAGTTAAPQVAEEVEVPDPPLS